MQGVNTEEGITFTSGANESSFPGWMPDDGTWFHYEPLRHRRRKNGESRRYLTLLSPIERRRYLSPRTQSRNRVSIPGLLAPPQAGHLPVPRQILQCSSAVFRRVFLPDPKHFGHSPEPLHIGHLEPKIDNAPHPSFDFAAAAPPSDFTGLRFEDELKRRN
jgi:hypothetical protein